MGRMLTLGQKTFVGSCCFLSATSAGGSTCVKIVDMCSARRKWLYGLAKWRVDCEDGVALYARQGKGCNGRTVPIQPDVTPGCGSTSRSRPRLAERHSGRLFWRHDRASKRMVQRGWLTVRAVVDVVHGCTARAGIRASRSARILCATPSPCGHCAAAVRM